MNPQRKLLIQKICEEIEKGSIVNGKKLFTERELSTYFSVKRSAIREALIILDALKVIEIKERQGIFLKTDVEFNNLDSLTFLPPIKILNQVFEFRLILEVSAAEIAASRRSDEHIMQLKNEIEFFSNINKSENSITYKLSSQHNIILHRLIMDATENRVNIEVFKSVLKLTESCFEILGGDRYNFNPYKLWREDLFKEHFAIVDAIVRGNVGQAGKAMKIHLKNSIVRNNEILQGNMYPCQYL